MNSGIYKITNTVNNKFYIGSSQNMEKRWIQHKSHLKCQRHHSSYLQNVANKYGIENLVFSVLVYCPKEDLLQLEQYLMDFYQPQYNISKLATSCAGVPKSEIHKQRLREANLGKKYSDETKRKHSERQKNFTQEQIDKAHRVKYKPVQQIDKLGNIIATFKSIQEACNKTGIWKKNIGIVANGKTSTKHAGGYSWKFI